MWPIFTAVAWFICLCDVCFLITNVRIVIARAQTCPRSVFSPYSIEGTSNTASGYQSEQLVITRCSACEPVWGLSRCAVSPTLPVQRSRRRRSFLASSALDPPLSLSFLICRNYIYSFDTARSGVYVTMGCPSVWLSYLAPQPWHEASLLLCPPMAGDIDRLLHGASAAGAVAFRSISTAARRSAANASIVIFTATYEAGQRLGSYVLTALRS